MPNLNTSILRGVLAPVPPAGLQKRFVEFVAAKDEQAETLHDKIENLRMTRDLLLPRLISGEIGFPHEPCHS